jgi:hypothetical protein
MQWHRAFFGMSRDPSVPFPAPRAAAPKHRIREITLRVPIGVESFSEDDLPRLAFIFVQSYPHCAQLK